ncbi:OmpP1/FadL family transporter [Parahaliea mediterranea]|uniref:OmpP1/FadL family transporter n=1 Tax=Parahaliea mediterranea TaxID=651086 RepID=UPI000E2EDDBD|nr:outer membrane protein transport protein [Parahaliea mediterranea]
MQSTSFARLAVVACLLAAPAAQSGGLWLNEYGDTAGGRASAGAAAGVDDASTLLHNPASAIRLDSSELLVSAALLQPAFEFQQQGDATLGPGGGNGGDAGVLSPSGGLFYVHGNNSDNWRAGIYFSGLAGVGLDYDDNWVGRYQTIESSLLIATLAPTLSWRFTDRLTFGASLQWYMAELDLSLRIPNPLPNRPDGEGTLDGTDNGFGFTAGALYELSEQTRLGLSYQSELNPDFGGQLALKGLGVDVVTNTDLTMAQNVRLGLHHRLNERLALDLTLGWDDWSELDEVFVAVASTGASLEKNSRDTTHVAIGMEYQFNPRWLVTAGVSYDTNPMDADFRTADMPLDRQIHVGVGGEYQLSDALTLGGYFNYADLGNARISAAQFEGEYEKAVIYQLGMNARWHF